ncbi:MAG: HAMP domain-containing sensor histidine kinase [Acetatifactor sp.]|nr:HAMP domain-containing sensor histidine kinase [Acetatifactor sp.]
MTKKLRHKFIGIIMSIVTIMLCVIMSMIYLFTKRNLESGSINMMQNLSEKPFLQHLPNELQNDMRFPYFTLQLDPRGNPIAAGGGYYDLSDENFLKSLIETTLSADAPTGIIEEYNLRFLRKKTAGSQIFIYADISGELATLNNLLRNCIFIGIVCFLAFLCISFLLANWIVQPVDKAWRQQRQFIADASHELKTPLTVIMTNAEMLQNMDYDEASHSTFSSNILVMSRQMRDLVGQMLELARADNVQDDMVFSSFDLSRLVSEAILPFEPVFFERGLTLHTNITENIRINGNPSELHQVLDILLDNAQKYSHENGSTWVTLQRHGKNHCLLTVADEGETIPPQDLYNLFKRFYRADQARSRNGSFGLGLSIAESIVKRHKGKIWAESKNGINTFFVELGKLGS